MPRWNPKVRGIALFAAGCLIGGAMHRIPPAPAFAAPPSARSNNVRFSIKEKPLKAAVDELAALLKLDVTLALDRGHPARRREVTLSMPVEDPRDLLNAVANAYGIRWVRDAKPNHVTFLSKVDYVGTSRGLRHGLADALPPELRTAVEPPEAGRLQRAEAPLKRLEETSAEQLIAATAGGPIPLDRFDPAVAKDLLLYLNSASAFFLGAACDRYGEQFFANRNCLFHYGENRAGTKQFSFKIGERWVVCKPE